MGIGEELMEDMQIRAEYAMEADDNFNCLVQDLIDWNDWNGSAIVFLSDEHFNNVLNLLKRRNKIDDEKAEELREIRCNQIKETLKNADETIDHFNKVLKMAKYLPLEDKMKSIKSANYVIENLTELKRRFK